MWDNTSSQWFALALIIIGAVMIVIGLILGFSGNSKCNDDLTDNDNACSTWLWILFVLGGILLFVGIVWLAVLLCRKPKCMNDMVKSCGENSCGPKVHAKCEVVRPAVVHKTCETDDCGNMRCSERVEVTK